jgi:hypothetical protein
MEKKIYIKIVRYSKSKINYYKMGSYILPVSEISNVIDAEFDFVNEDREFKIELIPVEMTEEEYKKLPDFTGYCIKNSTARAKAKWLEGYCDRQKDCPGCTFYSPKDAAEYDGITCQLARDLPDKWGIKAISTGNGE